MSDVPLSTAGRDALLRRVRAALTGDNLPLAEALAHEILRIEPTDGVAWAVLAHIASLIRRDDRAAIWRKQANTDVLSRFDAPVQPRVRQILEGCGSCQDEESFLLIKPWGQDLWTDAFHAVGALLLAEITNRQPCILWDADSRLLPEGESNVFPLLFNGVGTELVMFLRAAPADELFPGKWRAAGIEATGLDRLTPPHRGGEGGMAALWLLNRPERVVVSDFPIGVVELIPWIPEGHAWQGKRLSEIVAGLMERYFLPNWRIRDLVSERLSLLEGKRTVAVHIPVSETEAGSTALAQHYLTLVQEAVDRGFAIWLMTESQAVVDRYRERFGDAIHGLDALRSETRRRDLETGDPDDRLRVGEEAVADVLIGASCDRFIGNGTASPSCMVDFLMGGDRSRKHLFRPNRYRRRDLSLLEG